MAGIGRNLDTGWLVRSPERRRLDALGGLTTDSPSVLVDRAYYAVITPAPTSPADADVVVVADADEPSGR